MYSQIENSCLSILIKEKEKGEKKKNRFHQLLLKRLEILLSIFNYHGEILEKK